MKIPKLVKIAPAKPAAGSGGIGRTGARYAVEGSDLLVSPGGNRWYVSRAGSKGARGFSTFRQAKEHALQLDALRCWSRLMAEAEARGERVPAAEKLAFERRASQLGFAAFA
jgi:hypothetical protein